MVHALEIIRESLDRRSGLLIDIHPLAKPRRVSVRVDDHYWEAGALVDEDKHATYHAADRALAEAVERGLFAARDRHELTFLVHLDTARDLRDYLSEGELIGDEMDVTPIDEGILHRVDELLLAPGRRREVILERPVSMAAFLPIQSIA